MGLFGLAGKRIGGQGKKKGKRRGLLGKIAQRVKGGRFGGARALGKFGSALGKGLGFRRKRRGIFGGRGLGSKVGGALRRLRR